MFEVKPYKVIIHGMHEIVSNFYSLLNDGDNDILYTGTNKYGNRILGSIVAEDDENGFIRYYHIIVTDKQYSLFINKQISLRIVLEESESFFVIDKDYNNKIIDFNLVSFSDVPEQYLPLVNSKFPSFIDDSTLEYSFSLKGGISDMHKAEPDVMSIVNNKFSSVLKTSLGFVRSLNITPLVFSEAAMAGSFELNFRIEFVYTHDLFSKQADDIVKFMHNLYSYIFASLPSEEIGALKAENVLSEHFIEIEKEFLKIFANRGTVLPDLSAEQQLIDLISYTVENFKDMEYKGFDRVELLNKTTSGIKLPVAMIDKDFYNSVENKIFKPESLTKEDIIEIDEYPREYSIQVYSLNKETGNGAAYLTINNGIHKITLHLRGKDNYQNTIFTKNMDEETILKVNAIAKRVNSIVKELTFNFD